MFLFPAVMVVVALISASAEDAKLNDDTLGKPAPADAVVLLGPDSKDLSKWSKPGGGDPAWPLENGVMTVGSSGLVSKDSFGDFKLHLEFNVPYMPDARGQGRGNSGVYLQGRHEIQVLDSYGLDSKDNDCGGIYQQYAPTVNACKPPLQWQTYDITFHAAKVEDGKVIEKARVTVVHNGVTIHDNREIRPTPGGIDGDATKTTGPIYLQNHGNPVQFRNIWVQPIK
jgi:hypothetical protein